MITAGVDVGAGTVKIVVLRDGKVVRDVPVHGARRADEDLRALRELELEAVS